MLVLLWIFYIAYVAEASLLFGDGFVCSVYKVKSTGKQLMGNSENYAKRCIILSNSCIPVWGIE